MSAEVLRKAAALMRERAEAAYESPWRNDDDHVFTASHEDEPTVYVNGGVYRNMRATAEHIASWHPAVAIAVADWMDTQAIAAEFHEREDSANEFADGYSPRAETISAMAVATAYLGVAP